MYASISEAAEDLKARLRKVPKGRRAAIAVKSGVGESSIRLFLNRSGFSRSVSNLINLESALNDIEGAGDTPVPCAVGAEAQTGGEGGDCGGADGLSHGVIMTEADPARAPNPVANFGGQGDG